MSLVSQLNNRKSNVMSFFDDYQDSAGMTDAIKKCRAQYQSKSYLSAQNRLL